MTDPTALASRAALAAVDWAAARAADAVVKRIEKRIAAVARARMVARVRTVPARLRIPRKSGAA